MDWDKFFDPHSFKMRGETEAYEKIVQMIKDKKKISNGQLINDLDWGIRNALGLYRNRLRTDKRIKFTTNGYEWL